MFILSRRTLGLLIALAGIVCVSGCSTVNEISGKVATNVHNRLLDLTDPVSAGVGMGMGASVRATNFVQGGHSLPSRRIPSGDARCSLQSIFLLRSVSRLFFTCAASMPLRRVSMDGPSSPARPSSMRLKKPGATGPLASPGAGFLRGRITPLTMIATSTMSVSRCTPSWGLTSPSTRSRPLTSWPIFSSDW